MHVSTHQTTVHMTWLASNHLQFCLWGQLAGVVPTARNNDVQHMAVQNLAVQHWGVQYTTTGHVAGQCLVCLYLDAGNGEKDRNSEPTGEMNGVVTVATHDQTSAKLGGKGQSVLYVPELGAAHH